ncbi:formylglycine-generating enzyme family protein [Notoacmeibacter ruber]|uniref:Formylglycine-generating enzyme family protein n=1 Tax=Notoacmeibacter ruber TaxID=2670375 RepID=A0A3L7JAZ4_9HYPH|nr:SUMF1/EgtB/PvdO family nonheme iron enzyme [Notoacmeibacter ruber]RLQ87918.1 formylglycine-generating enzyme family protein [Notoacmeibacter ruber]
MKAPALSLKGSLVALGLAGLIAAAGAFALSAIAFERPDLSAMPRTLPVSIDEDGDHRTVWVQQLELSVAEWNRCYEDRGCGFDIRPRNGVDPEHLPATGLNHTDARQYVRWVSQKTGHPFRLPTSAEWTTMAKGVVKKEAEPIFDAPELSWASAYLIEKQKSRSLKRAGSFSVSAEGIGDLDGSVWEWTQDCYSSDVDPEHCAAFLVGGEHIAVIPFLERDPARGGCAVGTPPAHLGLRLVSDQEPPSA